MVTNIPNACCRVPRWYFFALGILVGAIVGVNAAGSLLVGGVQTKGTELVHVGPLSPAARVFALFLALASLLGIVVAAWFISRRRYYLNRPRPRIQPQVLLLGFLAGVLANILFGGILAGSLLICGVEPVRDVYTAIHIVAQSVAAVLGLLAAFAVLRFLTSYTREDVREIGWRSGNFLREVIWGVAGYCGAMPFVGLSVAIAQYLSRILFREAVFPEHPIVGQLLEGRAAFAAAVFLAAIVAPIVEEVFFRGYLHTALRSVMGFWGAGATSAAIFAAIHPTMPVGFLPLFALGFVLAVLRESTGSLVPSMVCHCVNNSVALALVRIIYGG
ncbi:MAG: type II CAAX endopeptidase family protein [Armatimonadota bacterium]|nr:type II CAAX endopeptidase family protein [Armatimonadota bacterium]